MIGENISFGRLVRKMWPLFEEFPVGSCITLGFNFVDTFFLLLE